MEKMGTLWKCHGIIALSPDIHNIHLQGTEMLDSLLKTLRGEATDEIVWTADIHYWISGQKQAGKSDPEWNTEEGYLKLCRDLGIMPYYWYNKFWLAKPEYHGVEISNDSKGGTHVRIWKTPLGELREESAFMVESCSNAVTKHPVESEEDLKILLYILEHRELVPDCMEDYCERIQLWTRYDGIPSIALPRSPLPAFFYEWAGLQNAVYLMSDFPEMVGQILHLMEEQELKIIDAVCRLAPPLVHFADNLSSENLSGFFDTYMAEQYRRRIRKLHAADVRCAVHLDGTTRGLLQKITATGVDAIEALTPQPVGDVAADEMRKLTGSDSIILWGGVPGAMFAPPYTWTDMKRHVEKLLDAWRGTPFVIGVGDQVPSNGDITMVKRISDMIKFR